MASEQPYIPPPPMPSNVNADGSPKSRSQIDADWQEYIRECRAIELAGIHRTTPEAIKQQWAEEDEFKAECRELESLADSERLRLRLAKPAPSPVPWTAGFRARPTPSAAARPAPPFSAAATDPDPTGLLSPTFTAEVEFRGETLHYVEPHRKTSCQFFWTREFCIYADTFTPWVATPGHPPIADVKLTPAERQAVVARVVAWAKRTQGVTLAVYNNA